MGISFRAIQSILTYILGMSKVSARLVLRMLTDDQERTRLDISRYLLSRYEDDPGANNGSTLAHPLLRNLRGFIQQEGDGLNLLG